MAVIVGKQVHKNAVNRNFFKRQARAALVPCLPAGYDILVIFSPAANRLKKKEIREELINAISTFKK
jgi:ribonuclease P protein component